ncbi:hypothetical protein PENSPDRAFT_647011 [Peniophora sp. CONT]|nr:hypothetical protein PENSPDRAFT_647011 [Peniophora sp. CONT]
MSSSFAKFSASLRHAAAEQPAHPYRPSSLADSASEGSIRTWPSQLSMDSVSSLSSIADDELAGLPLPTISPSTSRADFFATHRTWKEQHTSPALYLTLYLGLNLALTLHNKLVLSSFPYPLTLTALHCASAAAGCLFLRRRGFYVPKMLESGEKLVVGLFAVLYAVNVAVSNASLRRVSVPLHQTVRGMTPLFTLALAAYVLRGTRVTRRKVLALLPLVAGVALASAGDYSCSIPGLLLTLLGAALAAAKTVVTNALQAPASASGRDGPCAKPSPPLSGSEKKKRMHEKRISGIRDWEKVSRVPVRIYGLSISVRRPSLRGLARHMCSHELPRLALHPLDLLARMSPLACLLCLALAWSSGELAAERHALSPPQSVYDATSANNWTFSGDSDVEVTVRGASWRWMWDIMTLAVTLAVNAGIAFALNVTSFEANRRAGAVAMGVASNVKQALTVLAALALFDFSLAGPGLAGVALTLGGGALYARVERGERAR